MDSFEIILILVAGLIWVIQKLVEGARKIRQSSLTPDEKRKLKQERLEAQRAWKEQKRSESVLFAGSRTEASEPPPVPPVFSPAAPVPIIVPAPPKRHPPRLDLGGEPEPLERTEAMQMLWQKAVEAKPAALPAESLHRRHVTNAEVQHGYVHHAGFDRQVLRRLLAAPGSLRTAILLQEILGPPKAKRR